MDAMETILEGAQGVQSHETLCVPGQKLSAWLLRNMRAPCFPSTAILVFALCLYEKFCVGVDLGSRLSLRGGKASPMAGYWRPDASDMNIFEYNAIGMDPIQDSVRDFKSGKGQVKATGENGADTENPAIQKIIDNTNYAQRFFTGRKVADDCPTFPFCNHIPAPRPMLLPPASIENPNSRILYPWQNKNGNSPAFAGTKENVKQHVLGHAGRIRENVGQMHDVRKKWSRPYGRFGGNRQMEDWSRNMYGSVMGALPVTNRVSSIGNGKDLSKTKESMSGTSLDKANKVRVPRLQNVGPGDIPAAPASRSEYIPAQKVNKNWDGKEAKIPDKKEQTELNEKQTKELTQRKKKEEKMLLQKKGK